MANKTVHFMEACWKDPSDNVSPMEPGFWRYFVEAAAGMSEQERTVPYMGLVLEGETGRDARTSLDYVYIAKERSAMDRPHTKQGPGLFGTIMDGPTVKGVYEPTYAAGVGGTNIAAFMRTSGAASWSAIEDWLNGVVGPQEGGNRVALRAVVSHNGFQELQRCFGVSKIHVKGDADAFQDIETRGEIVTAVQQAGRVASGLSIDLTLSFGHATPEDHSAERLKSELEDFLEANKHNLAGKGSKASATLMFARDDGGVDRRPVDFIYNKITTKERVDLIGDEPTRDSVLLALQSAIQRYQNNEL